MMRGGGGTWPGGSYSTGTMGPGMGPGSMFGRAGSATLGSGTGGTLKDLWRALSFLKGHKQWVIGSYCAWLVANFLDLMIPLQVRRAIDQGITTDPQHTGNHAILITSVLVAIVLYVAKSGINWIYIWGFHAYEAD